MKPLHDAGRIRRVVVSTYQATSGAGVAGQRDLERRHRGRTWPASDYEYEAFAHPIAFNLIPQIGSPKHEGYTSEEMKMVYETQKIFGDDSIQVCPTCVRVPVTNCHSESILVETEKKITVERGPRAVRRHAGHRGDRRPGQRASTRCRSTATATTTCSSAASAKTSPCDNGLAFWCVSDNLRKGAATNAVQIAELLVKHAAGVA